jgi:predicted TIM-barrel fold metal-dependent hydrolase
MRITRRAALLGAAGAVALPALRTGSAGSAPSRPGPDATIDLHAHAMPASYLEAIEHPGSAVLPTGEPVPHWTPEAALAHMAASGVDRQVLSVPDPALALVPRAARRRVATAINDELADLVRREPGRFSALAVLPLGDQVATMREIRRVRRLGLAGVILPTNVEGRYLGEPAFELAMFELNRLGMLALIHPTAPAPGDAPAALELPPGLLDTAFEPVRATASLLYSLTLTRYPRIRFVLADGGGAVPFLWYRIGVFTGRAVLSNLLQRPTSLGPLDLTRSLARLRVDTAAGAADPANLAAIRASVGIERLVFGSNWPLAPGGDDPLAELASRVTAQELTAIRAGAAALR